MLPNIKYIQSSIKTHNHKECRMSWDVIQYHTIKHYGSKYQVLSQQFIHDTPRKYIESSWPMGSSRGPYTDTDDLHVSVRMISIHCHKSKNSARAISTCPNYNHNLFIARTIFTCSTRTISTCYTFTHIQSHVNACAQYDIK